MKTAQTVEDAWAIEEKRDGEPHGWIQWKGTDVCMDVRCKCGHSSHIDGYFAYSVKCPVCGTCYACNGHIEFVEVLTEPASVKIADV